MMQSVALTDSCQQEEEYVIVEASDSELHNLSSDDGDDASYDHCDDVYSLSSVVQPFPYNMTGLPAIEEDFFDFKMPAIDRVPGVPGQELCLPVVLDSMMTNSETSMNFDIDATDDSIQLSKTSSLVHRLEPLESTSPNEEQDMMTGLESSDEEHFAQSETSSRSFGSSPHNKGSSSGSCGDSTPEDYELRDGKQTADNSDDETVRSFPHIAVAPPAQASATISRISNKKRRKQVKLARKAAAAAAAAAAFSQTTLTSSRSPARSKRDHATNMTRKKNISASIAVVCAKEAIAIYKKEIEAGSKTV